MAPAFLIHAITSASVNDLMSRRTRMPDVLGNPSHGYYTYHWLTNNNNNNNNNTQDNIYSAVIISEVIARVHSVHLVNVEQRQAASTLRLSHMTWAVSPPVGSYHLQPPSPFIITTQPESWYSFTVPREWPRHCRKGAHSVCPRLYITVVLTINTTAHSAIRSQDLTHC